jgi:hypothetical protein
MGLSGMAVMAATYLAAGRGLDDPAMVYLVLWEAAFFYRGVIYPWKLRTTNRGFPAVLVMGGIVVKAMGAFINGYFLFMLPLGYTIESFLTMRSLIGIALFALGFALHVWSDTILAGLRGREKVGYSVPQRGPFRLVSSPNYLGAIIQWCGWAVLVWNLPGLALAWFTFGFLFPRALANHRWYRAYFPSYPQNRRAVIPFLL